MISSGLSLSIKNIKELIRNETQQGDGFTEFSEVEEDTGAFRLTLWGGWLSPLHPRAASLAGFPGGARGKEPAYQCRRHKRYGFDPWVGKIPWRRAWQPTPVFLPGEPHGQRSLVGYSPWGSKESDMD